MKTALIMLAAGNSRRFGSNKLMYEVEGQPMYKRVLNCLLEVQRILREKEGESCSLTVVTQYAEIGETAKAAGAQVLYNLYPEEGISFSLKIGLKANLQADACLFTVSDQPWLKAETVLGLLDSFQKSKKGAACVFAGEKPGNPCVFSKKYYKELLSLSGDAGGRRIICAYPKDTAAFQVKEERELEDIDYSV